MHPLAFFVGAYLGSSLLATMVYVDRAHRMPVPPDLDAEAQWWQAFSEARERLGHRPSHAEVEQELQAA